MLFPQLEGRLNQVLLADSAAGITMLIADIPGIGAGLSIQAPWYADR
jgi:hypothetical protein